ncbi:MAG: sensor histidine kinase [Acidimicrobiia bacterium]|nr:sensor histidine kinase [Acidimicrobiia bacterium]
MGATLLFQLHLPAHTAPGTILSYFTTSLVFLGGMSAGVGLLYLFVSMRRTVDRRLNVLFGLFAMAYAGWALAVRAGYLASDVAGLLAAGRFTAVFASLGYSLLVWYVAAYADIGPRLSVYGVSGAWAVVGLASLVLPEDLLIAPPVEVSTVTLPWGETVQTVEASGALLVPLVVVSQVAFLIYVVWATVLLVRRGRTRSAVVLGIGVGWFIAMVVGDVFVVNKIIDFVYLYSFGFFGFVVTMAVDTADRAIRTEHELSALQAGLESEVADRTARLEAAQTQLVARATNDAAVAERNRLARELHDAVTQVLFSINLLAGTLGRLWRTDPEAGAKATDEVRRLARGGIAEMRVLLRELRPDSIADTDLGTLVSQLADGIGVRYGISTKAHTAFDGDLPEDVRLAFYRITQEATNNVVKHADANDLTVNLAGDHDEVRLLVRDDGVGFDTDTPTNGTMGLRIMQERAAAIGADLAVVSSPSAGTSVTVAWTPQNGTCDR